MKTEMLMIRVKVSDDRSRCSFRCPLLDVVGMKCQAFPGWALEIVNDKREHRFVRCPPCAAKAEVV